MSTNYYLHKEPYGRRHIGKTYFGGADRGSIFIWAIEPEAFEHISVDFDAETVEVIDEYDRRMTLSDFKRNVLVHVKGHETDNVGRDFS